MPTEYTCSSCGLTISVGCYHGFSGGSWFNALYCRHCGTGYSLRQTAAQFFDGFGIKRTERDTREYTLRGPSKTQRVVVAEHSPRPTLICEVCRAEGPFGGNGPITDEAPEGLASERSRPSGDTNPAVTGKCPKCRKQAMRVSGEWIT